MAEKIQIMGSTPVEEDLRAAGTSLPMAKHSGVQMAETSSA